MTQDIDIEQWAAAAAAATEIAPERPAPLIDVGAQVYSWWDDEPVEWGGPPEYADTPTLKFGMFSGGKRTRYCDIDRVMPVGAPTCEADERLWIGKGKKPGPWLPGNWNQRITMPDGNEHSDWYRTKRDATAEGRRRLAILTFHAEANTNAT